MSPPLAKARFSVDFFERNFNPCQGINRATAFPAQMRRTSIYSIPPGIQRLGAISQGDTRSGIAHPEPAREEVSPCPPNQRSIPRVLPRSSRLVLSYLAYFRRQ